MGVYPGGEVADGEGVDGDDLARTLLNRLDLTKREEGENEMEPPNEAEKDSVE